MMEPEKFIYAIRAVCAFGPVKIGCSKKPKGRLAAHFSWSPYPLEIVATVSGSHRDEVALHDFLARSHSHAEWFKPTDDVLRVVDLMKRSFPIDYILSTFDACPFPRKPRGGAISWKFRRDRNLKELEPAA